MLILYLCNILRYGKYYIMLILYTLAEFSCRYARKILRISRKLFRAKKNCVKINFYFKRFTINSDNPTYTFNSIEVMKYIHKYMRNTIWPQNHFKILK